MKVTSLAAALAFVFVSSGACLADTFKVLDAFEANPDTGILDLDLNIQPETTRFKLVDEVGKLQVYDVRSNVYQACLRNGSKGGDSAERNHCSKNLYGGPRLILKQGDKIRVQLHNKSEAFKEYGSQEPEDTAVLPKSGEGHIVDACANIHTHGLIVRANAPDDRRADEPADRFGDNVFVVASPEKSPPGSTGCPGEEGGHSAHAEHMKMVNPGSIINYEIKIPGEANVSSIDEGGHPSGLFWFHPHVHSLAKEEVSGGLTGMVNVGSIKDYGCLAPAPDGTCKDKENEKFPPLRHMLLKDVQIGELNGAENKASVIYDQDAGFCEGQTEIGLKGFCNHFSSNSELTGRWLFNINGAVHPEWNVPSGRAEIWRIQNASANVTYDLRLGGGGWVADTGQPLTDKGGMPFQLLSLDGVGLGLAGGGDATGFQRPQAFQRRLLLMPGSRAEILVAMRDPEHCDVSQGQANWGNCPAYAPLDDTKITIVNAAYATGGDTWPKIELAEITYNGRQRGERLVSGIALKNLNESADATLRARPRSVKALKNNLITDLCKTGFAKRLAGLEKRRVYFGIVTDEAKPNKDTDPNWRAETFVLGASIIGSDGKDYDEDGNLLPDGPLLYAADMASLKSDLCVPHGEEETWELVNISEEVHNFHIHQTKFKVAREDNAGHKLIIAQDPIDDVNIPDVLISKSGEDSVTHDTILVPRGKAEADCGTDLVGSDPKDLAKGHFTKPNPNEMAYRIKPGSNCRGNYGVSDQAGAMGIRIPFTRSESIGRYVYHCHILEHEDLGMMASIRVLSERQLAGINEQ
jgi:L-ascorbate oxidase